ncbi:MAG: hypothetical protein ABGZ35_27440 [Planctomycetaceae bacterium]|jgi:hypothetical protein
MAADFELRDEFILEVSALFQPIGQFAKAAELTEDVGGRDAHATVTDESGAGR